MTFKEIFRENMNILHCIVTLCGYVGFPDALASSSDVLNPITEFERVRLMKTRIVPDLVSVMPNQSLIVTYEKVIVHFGNLVDKYQILDRPDHFAWPAKKDTFYTLVLTGSDAPKNKSAPPEYLHWIVGNIPEEKWWKGENVTQYQGLLTGFHYGVYRVVFFLFEQPKRDIRFEVELTKSNDKEEPWHFSTKVFAETYKLGNPIALNYCILDFEGEMKIAELDPMKIHQYEPDKQK